MAPETHLHRCVAGGVDGIRHRLRRVAAAHRVGQLLSRVPQEKQLGGQVGRQRVQGRGGAAVGQGQRAAECGGAARRVLVAGCSACVLHAPQRGQLVLPAGAAAAPAGGGRLLDRRQQPSSDASIKRNGALPAMPRRPPQAGSQRPNNTVAAAAAAFPSLGALCMALQSTRTSSSHLSTAAARASSSCARTTTAGRRTGHGRRPAGNRDTRWCMESEQHLS